MKLILSLLVLQIQSELSTCESKINSIINKLYGLTEEEIAIIENSIQ